jgi:hypothetical protein
VTGRLDEVEDALEVLRVAGSDLEEVVRLARDVVALLELGDERELSGEVGRDRARRLGDPGERDDAVADGGRIDLRAVAADDPAPRAFGCRGRTAR